MESVSDALAPYLVGVDHHTIRLRIAPPPLQPLVLVFALVCSMSVLSLFYGSFLQVSFPESLLLLLPIFTTLAPLALGLFPTAPLEVSLGLHHIEISRSGCTYKLQHIEITAVAMNAKYLSLLLADGGRAAVSLPAGLDLEVRQALLELLNASIARDKRSGEVPAEIERLRGRPQQTTAAHSSR